MGGQRFLFEVLPDFFPHGFLTEVEIELWSLFYASKQKQPTVS